MATRNKYPRLAAPPGGLNRHAPTIVMTWQLAAVIERELPKIQKRVEDKSNRGWHGKQNEPEGIGIIAAATAQLYDSTPDAVVRKLWGIRSGERGTCDGRFADCLMLALDTDLATEGIATFPSNTEGAFQMIDGYCFAKGEPTPIDSAKFVRTLMNFTKGFVHWEKEIQFAAPVKEQAA